MTTSSDQNFLNSSVCPAHSIDNSHQWCWSELTYFKEISKNLAVTNLSHSLNCPAQNPIWAFLAEGKAWATMFVTQGKNTRLAIIVTWTKRRCLIPSTLKWQVEVNPHRAHPCPLTQLRWIKVANWALRVTHRARQSLPSLHTWSPSSSHSSTNINLSSWDTDPEQLNSIS